ncbi:glycoside hydrolase family 2 protein [Piedraia hortae CBS 480.64]|uniref:Glycoside hydrolase family 2 protein n=1 Tax=Piedraia hortae CBS 480.64 TaxID=1314780 RepID=A0A6A7CBH7_9PEZI|nr:glycoside hydrolase family 2 protein [Piedraia hortae CBS 480.64]
MHKLSRLIHHEEKSSFPGAARFTIPPMTTVFTTHSPDLDGYPCPDFRRSSLKWELLDGQWDFAFDDEDIGLRQGWHRRGLQQPRKIQVPFVYQSPASGISERAVHEVLWYQRLIKDVRSVEEQERGHVLLLRFGAVDYHAKVWLNGNFVGEHRGGHVPFDLDLSDAILLCGAQDSYTLSIRVYDSAFDLTQPRGKQYWGPESRDIFYTPSSGIWQSVWIESVPTLRLADSSNGTIIRSNDIEKGVIDARIAIQGRRARCECSVSIEASFCGVLVSSSERKNSPKEEDFVRFDQDMRITPEKLPAELLRAAPLDNPACWHNGVALWSPEWPLLYDLTIRLHDSAGGVLDEVKTTTGMRSLDWTTGDGTLRLNNQPYFQALFLDQGYWPETLMTPPTQAALREDIVLSKSMGFNGCRKHQKVESAAFMHCADRLGFLVWGEMASCYNFSMDAVDRFNQEWMEMVRRDINRPSIVAWTPVNESWGYPNLGEEKRQRDHIRSLYYMTKTLDPNRPINDNCGWEHVITDLSTFHDYADAKGMAERCVSVQSILSRGRNMFLAPIRGPDPDPGSHHKQGAPVLCTEFGGVNIAVRNDDSRKGNWGYTTASDSQDLLRRFDGLVMATVGAGNVCGIVWTQFSDIEQEMNGLFTLQREPKVPPPEAAKVMARARQAYYSRLGG